MLYLFFGKDSFRIAEKLRESLAYLTTEDKNRGVFRIEAENFQEAEFEELIKSRTLFNAKNITVCRGLAENKSSFDFVLKNLSKCAKSENIFIFLETELKDDVLDLFKKETQEIQRFDLLPGTELKKWILNKVEKTGANMPLEIQIKIANQCGSDLWRVSKEIEKYALGKNSTREFAEQTKEEYNPFAICDAIAQKNKTKAWILFQKALLSGVPAEKVFWKIVWQIKNLLLVKKLSQIQNTNLLKESGLKPYPLKKAISAINNFTEDELSNYSSDLIKLYHNSKKSFGDFSAGLERILIKRKGGN